MRLIRARMASSMFAISIVCASTAFAAPTAAQRARYDIPSEPLGTALIEVGRISGRQILFPGEQMRGLVSPTIHGELSPEEALAKLLKGTTFTIESTGEAIFIRARSSTGLENKSSAPIPDDQIVVTGSRIPGAPVASPVIAISSDDILNAGQTSLPEALQSLPQSFGGGLNPGVGIGVPEGNGENQGSVATVNLRGLGSDATLTLLNGHRLAYAADTQSVDISTIPLAAVESIEIVADGASAIYGSDAVAGVANIKLKKDYDGASVTARVGGSTNGGDFQQQYSGIAGTKWGTGGIYAAYEHEHDTAITASERDYTRQRALGLTLLPSNDHNNILVSGHQSLTDNLAISIDGLYSSSKSDQRFALTPSGDYLSLGEANAFNNKSFAISPSIRLALPSDWKVELDGVYGEERSRYTSAYYVDGVDVSPTVGCYCTTGSSIELSGSGNLFTLPAGPVKVAIGGGYHDNHLHGYRTEGSAQNIIASQKDYFGYAEVSLPFVSRAQGLSWLQSANLSGALRYERYPGIGTVTTPKVGLIVEPTDDFEFKASWGKSFKAPTLYQRFSGQYAAVDYAANSGGVGLPAGSTAILQGGGNPNLKPERAEGWSTTVAIHPRSIPKLSVEIGYFNIHYKDRVVSPITYTSEALANPLYADYVVSDPPDSQKAAALAGRSVYNYFGGVNDPTSVVAIIDDSNVNAESQRIHGVDVLASYRFGLLGGSLLTEGNFAYLHSVQAITSLQPVLALAGTLFNPPHVRARGGATWSRSSWTASSYLNYIGGVTDNRASAPIDIRGMTTWDLSLRYSVHSSSGLLNNVQIGITASNLLDTRPAIISVPGFFYAPYDSTNYSVQGRFVILSVTKSL